jgi:hypothetical protein
MSCGREGNPPRQPGALRRALRLGMFMATLGVASASAAPPIKAPAWGQISPEQQQILAPLQKDWDSLSAERRRKWIGIAQRYPKMKPAEQERVQRRMNDWANLSPQQRRQARENYRTIGKLAADKRADLAQRWAEYQALPEDERQSLVAPPSPPPVEPKRRPRATSQTKP